MSQITKKRIIDEEERLQDLNTEANKVKLQITELLKEKESLEKDILSRGSEFSAQLSKQEGELNALAIKKDSLESAIKVLQDSMSELNTQKVELDFLIETSNKELGVLETLKKSASDSAEKSVQAKLKTESDTRGVLENATLIKSIADALLDKNNQEKQRLMNYDKSIQEREAKLAGEMAKISQANLALTERAQTILDREKEIATEFDHIKKNIADTEAMKLSAKTNEDLIGSKLRNAKTIESEALAKKEAILAQEEDLHNREREYNFKLSELQIKERAIKIREKKFQLDE